MRTIVIVLSLYFLFCSESNQLTIKVTNPADIRRPHETIEIPMDLLAKRLSYSGESFRVSEANTNTELVSQLVDHDSDGQDDLLIFQSHFEPHSGKEFFIRTTDSAPLYESKVYATFVPQHNDNFTWENDRIAFRLYGQAAKKVLVSSGIDVWTKRVPWLIIEKWYQPGVNYHKDTGEGADYYNVGKTCGCGGTAIYEGGVLYHFENYRDWQIIANGPIRTQFRLTFDAIDVNGVSVSEIKQITLDAGQQLNRVRSSLRIEGNGISDFATGIVLHPGSETTMLADQGILGVWEPLGEEAGQLGCGLIALQPKSDLQETVDHALVTFSLQYSRKFDYLMGAAWSKAGVIPDRQTWQEVLENWRARFDHPLEISFEN